MTKRQLRFAPGQRLWTIALLTLLVVTPSCSSPTEKQTQDPTSNSGQETNSTKEGPPPDVVVPTTQQVELIRGHDIDAEISVKIAKGYHINGNPASKFQIATTLEIEPVNGITLGKTVYPPSETKKFSFSNEPIQVYEDVAVIKQPLRADAGATSGNTTLRGKLTVQPCDDTVCFPPRTLKVEILVNIK